MKRARGARGNGDGALGVERRGAHGNQKLGGIGARDGNAGGEQVQIANISEIDALGVVGIVGYASCLRREGDWIG